MYFKNLNLAVALLIGFMTITIQTRIIIICVLSGLLFTACQQKNDAPDRATIWGEDKISTAAPEFATTVNLDQTEVFFNRTSKDRSIMQIMHVTFDGKNWSEAKSLPFSTGQYRDVDPFLTPDGKRLYFSSTRPVNDNEKGGVYNTWFVEKVDDTWSNPINPGKPLNSDSTDIFITLSEKHNAYFLSEREGKRDVMVSKYSSAGYDLPKKIELKLHGKPIYAGNPCIASDESFLIVAARDPKGNGAPDLFISWNVKGEWTALKNLGETINSKYADFAPALSKNNETLFFTSERPGIVPQQPEGVRPPGDIYFVNLKQVLKNLK